MGKETCVLTKENRGVEYSREIQADRITIMSSATKADDILKLVSGWLKQSNNKKTIGKRDAELYLQIVEIIER